MEVKVMKNTGNVKTGRTMMVLMSLRRAACRAGFGFAHSASTDLSVHPTQQGLACWKTYFLSMWS